jgi:hypothetical protein
MEDEYKFLALDIKNFYISTQIEQILHITESFLKFSNTENILKQQILQSLHTIFISIISNLTTAFTNF